MADRSGFGDVYCILSGYLVGFWVNAGDDYICTTVSGGILFGQDFIVE